MKKPTERWALFVGIVDNNNTYYTILSLGYSNCIYYFATGFDSIEDSNVKLFPLIGCCNCTLIV